MVCHQKKINKDTSELNCTIQQMDIYRMLHATAVEYIFFSGAHGNCSKIDHILDHKTSLNKYKKLK
jgi:hypothetical protein